MNKIEELAIDMKTQKNKIGVLKSQMSILENEYKELNDKYLKDFVRITTIMNKAEKDVFKLMDLNYPAVSIVGYNDRIKSIKKGLISISVRHMGRMGSGDWYTSVRIPINYFDMSNEEIKKSHTEWITNELIKREKKNKAQERKTKKQQYLELKKELGL